MNQGVEKDGDFSKELFAQFSEDGLNEQLKLMVDSIEGEYRLSVFKETKCIPTYIYGFVAGPYFEIKGKDLYKVFLFFFF